MKSSEPGDIGKVTTKQEAGRLKIEVILPRRTLALG
jgi:hypothetical protein